MRKNRIAFTSAFAACLFGFGLARADDATTEANKLAYDASLKCFVANGVARSDALNAGKQALADSIERKARESFDSASALADALGYSGSRFNQDLGLAQSKELPQLVQSPAYFRKIAATCKALELM